MTRDRGATAVGVGFLLLLALSLGLATGLAEAAFLARRAALHVFVWHGRQALWMMPLAEGVVFLGAGLGIAAAGRVSRRLRTLSASVGILAALSAWSALTLYGRLHPASILLLAAGLGAGAARLARARPERVRRLVGWSFPPLLALVVALAVGLELWLDARERHYLAALPPAPRNAPNVLLIVLDTVRAPSMSLYGHPRPTTPNLERWARGGVRFDRAIAPSSWTLPSHATFFTGRQPHEHRVNWQTPLDAAYPTLAEVLGRHGWRTAGFVANRPYTSWETGLARGFSRYEDYGLSFGEWVRCSTLARTLAKRDAAARIPGIGDLPGRRDAADVNRRFLDWAGEPSPHPFFAFLNYYDAHFPYLPPAAFAARFGAEEDGAFLRSLNWGNRLGRDRPAPTPSEARRARNTYEGAIAYLDFELGRLFAELEHRGLLDDTIVIVTSDHGEEFAEHRVTDHGNSLYLPALHVPLVIVGPGRVPSGLVVDEPVGLRDLPATIVALLGVEADSPFPGRSLVPPPGPESPPAGAILSEIRGVPGVPEWFPNARGAMRSLVLDSLHYILDGDRRERIYDIERDPWETRDLAPESSEELRLRLREALGEYASLPPRGPRTPSGTRPTAPDRRRRP
jgi:arylsulfatase A-like enzyme